MPGYRIADQAHDDLFDIWRYIAVESNANLAERQNDRFHAQFR